ncbi:hypothetical protein [Leuconostoc suionicum]|uniref:hypothetical protein n=1 Tax=Leuconostoc suionicum TaxID=1511761 RepID=UPI001FD40620|nr:hypothetical protein [Leuconostoc suionicum]
MVKINPDDLQVSTDTIKSWIEQYDQFLTKYTGDGDGISVMIDSKGLTPNSFHNETGRGGYFNTASGTSEGQTTTIRGCLLAYQATGEQKWYDRAMVMVNAMLNVLYQGKPIPTTPDVTWVPHWLFSAKEDFKSQEYFTDLKVKFVNGKATIKMTDIFKVFSVRATDATLVWDSPFSQVNGTGYDIKNIDYLDDNTAVVTLNQNITSDTLVVYGTNTGEVIHLGENYDAYPIWRKLEYGETVCAIDSMAWAMDVFKILYDITHEQKWLQAFNSTCVSIRSAYHIDNSIVYITPPKAYGNIFENGMYHYSSRTPEETYSQNKQTGLIDAHYPAISGNGDGQIGRGSVNASFATDSYIRAQLASKQAITVNLMLDEDSVYDPNKRWTAPLHLDGTGNIQTFDLKKENFLKTSNIAWGANYKQSDNTPISDSASKVTSSVVIDKNTAVTDVKMTKSASGWAQFLFGIGKMPTFPFDFRYHTNDDIDFAVHDANDKAWRYRLPKSKSNIASAASYDTISLTADKFTSDDGLTSFPSGSFKSLLVDSQASSTEIFVDYIGSLITLPADTTYSTVTLSYSGKTEATLSIQLVAPMPQTELVYTPFVAPFDYHLFNGVVNSWRGPAYSGYQTPYAWDEMSPFDDGYGDNSVATDTNMRFMIDAQNAYEKATGISGGFAPAFYFDRWDSLQYGHEPNTWAWLDAPDPNVNWGGFQYRAIDSVARVAYDNPKNDVAKYVAMKFYRFIDTYWTTEFNMPTVFNESAPVNTYDDTHMSGLLLRSLVRIYQVTTNRDDLALILKLINKTLAYMQHFHVDITKDAPFSTTKVEGTFSTEPAKGEWYGFWGGEILASLSLLLLNTRTDTTNDPFYYVYIEDSNNNSNEKAVTLINNSEYFGTQAGSPSVITITGPLTVNPTWKIVQDGTTIATAKFNVTLASSQRLVISSYPEMQYARVYNPDGSYADVSQLQDFTQVNYLRIPEGISTLLAYVDDKADVNVTFKEERLLV